jgi:hypothetical protein
MGLWIGMQYNTIQHSPSPQNKQPCFQHLKHEILLAGQAKLDAVAAVTPAVTPAICGCTFENCYWMLSLLLHIALMHQHQQEWLLTTDAAGASLL